MNSKKTGGGWYEAWGGTTFGYGVMLAPGQSPATLFHEMVHVEQLEAGTLAGLLLGVLVGLATRSWEGLAAGVGCWLLSAVLAYVGALWAAWLRNESSSYRGNHLEEAAYNATEVSCRPRS